MFLCGDCVIGISIPMLRCVCTEVTLSVCLGDPLSMWQIVLDLVFATWAPKLVCFELAGDLRHYLVPFGAFHEFQKYSGGIPGNASRFHKSVKVNDFIIIFGSV